MNLVQAVRSRASRMAEGADAVEDSAFATPVIVATVAGMTVLLSLHIFVLVDRFAVNLLTDDLWDVYGAFFSGGDAWQIFRREHLPHRQGLGNLMLAAVNDATAWNLRAVSFSMAGMLVIICLAMLALRVRVAGSLRMRDIAIPAAVLTASQYATLVRVPNPAHSVLPLMLLTAAAMSWLLKRRALRLSALGTILFCAVHTGFGFFIVPVFAMRLAIGIWTSRGDPRAVRYGVAGLVLCVACLAFFFVGYTPWWKWGNTTSALSASIYALTFVQIALARFVGISFMQWGLAAAAIGLILVSALVLTLAGAARRLLRNAQSPRDEVIFLFSAFSLLFIVAAALGRAHESALSGENSRYMTLLIPGFVAMHMAALRLKAKRWSIALIVLLLAGSFPLAISPRHPAAARARAARQWIDCYRSSGSEPVCREEVRFAVYPNPEKTDLAEKLAFLKRHDLHFFAESAQQLPLRETSDTPSTEEQP